MEVTVSVSCTPDTRKWQRVHAEDWMIEEQGHDCRADGVTHASIEDIKFSQNTGNDSGCFSTDRVEIETANGTVNLLEMSTAEREALKSFLRCPNINTNEEMVAELRKLSNPIVWVNKDDVRQWQEALKTREAMDLKRLEVNLDNREVNNWVRGKTHTLVPPLRKQVIPVACTTKREANAKVWRQNRFVNLNKTPARPEVMQSPALTSVACNPIKPFPCNMCTRRYKHKKSLLFHFRKIHLNFIKYRCAECSKGYLSKSNYDMHVKRHVNERLHRCNRCKQKYYSVGQLRKHKTSCGVMPSLKCRYCDKLFVNRETLKNHLVTELSNRTYKCCYCGMKTNHYASMYNHIAAGRC